MPEFKGPLFVMGYSRSGTKLVRAILNNHSAIYIGPIESLFLPRFAELFGTNINLNDASTMKKFCDEFNTTSFQWYWTQKGKRQLTPEILQKCRKLDDWQEILHFIYDFYYGPTSPEKVIWGDKSSHMDHIPLLKRICPDARILYVMRDPRDVVASARRAWGRNVERDAARWARSVGRARIDAEKIGSSYAELKYEDLLTRPKQTLETALRNIDLQFEDKILQFDRPTEEKGEGHAGGSTTLVSTNTGNYKKELNKKEVKRVEEITLPLMTALGYVPEYATEHKPLGSFREWMCCAHDYGNALLSQTRRRGIVKGLTLSYRIKRQQQLPKGTKYGREASL